MIALRPGERGLLLLCSELDDTPPLTPAQYRDLLRRVAVSGSVFADAERELTAAELIRIGCETNFAQRVERLMNREAKLDVFLQKLEHRDMFPITRLSEYYPDVLRQKLHLAAPVLLFGAGNPTLLRQRAVSAVGSRALRERGRMTAQRIGRMAAANQWVLCSGGAVGADEAATQAGLSAGGSAVLYLAGNLEQEAERWRWALPSGRLLLLSEQSPFASFSAARALTRNHYIHAHGAQTVVCQVSDQQGGTWRGTVDNLREGWSPVWIEAGSHGADLLLKQGARSLDWQALEQILTTE